MSTFSDHVSADLPRQMAEKMASVDEGAVLRVLASSRIKPEDAPVLFSPPARKYLEQLAQKSRRLTLERFGRAVTLYAPIYLSSACTNQCSYCGFAAHRDIERIKLSPEQAMQQAEILFEQGLRHWLLLTGEAPSVYGMDDICKVARLLRPKAASLSVEIFPTDLAGYKNLARAGVDGLVIYQETYDRDLYARIHEAGPKRNFDFRMSAIEHGGQAGFRTLGIGALLGLAHAPVEACMMAAHGAYLQKRFPQARLAISFPRLRPVPGGTPVLHPVSDADLTQLIVGMRLMFPDAELVMSTREPAPLRDRLIPLGITRMSAGSRTTPGGYGHADDAEKGQFVTEDQRSVFEVASAIRAAGYDVVYKDFDPALVVDSDML